MLVIRVAQLVVLFSADVIVIALFVEGQDLFFLVVGALDYLEHQFSCFFRDRLGGFDLELVRAHLHDQTHLQGERLLHLQKGARGAPDVLNEELVVLENDFRVVAGYAFFVDQNLVA